MNQLKENKQKEEHYKIITMSKLNIGDKAPEINAVDQNGNNITLDQYKGKKVVLYFYPKDMTSGCTAQACNLSDNYSKLIKSGYDVIGVSCDSIKRHQKFIEKYDLPFNLISDEDQKVVNDYGVWQLKKFMGREYMGIVRTTFLIDEEGVVRHAVLNDLPLGRNIDEMLRMIDALSHHQKHGEVCPAGWKDGDNAMAESPEGVSSYLSENAESL